VGSPTIPQERAIKTPPMVILYLIAETGTRVNPFTLDKVSIYLLLKF
jgi:hypothetical protein